MGSFGKVYKCINKLDRKEYAVKETIRKFVGRYKAYGLNEMKALAQLTALEDNADVVRYYHSWVEDDKLFLVVNRIFFGFFLMTYIRWNIVLQL